MSTIVRSTVHIKCQNMNKNLSEHIQKILIAMKVRRLFVKFVSWWEKRLNKFLQNIRRKTQIKTSCAKNNWCVWCKLMKELLLPPTHTHMSCHPSCVACVCWQWSEFMFYSAGVCFPPISQTGKEEVRWIANNGHTISHYLTWSGFRIKLKDKQTDT